MKPEAQAPGIVAAPELPWNRWQVLNFVLRFLGGSGVLCLALGWARGASPSEVLRSLDQLWFSAGGIAFFLGILGFKPVEGGPGPLEASSQAGLPIARENTSTGEAEQAQRGRVRLRSQAPALLLGGILLILATVGLDTLRPRLLGVLHAWSRLGGS